MNTRPDPAAPTLEPPGAGLPWAERMLARLIVRWKAARSTRADSAARFAHERAKLLALARGCDEATGRRRVLVKRQVAMEDSSRFWSVYMTLDHLRIVNSGTADVIRQLGQGEVPARTASIAAVKPSPDVGPEVIAAFEESCDALQHSADGLGDLHTAARYMHPWFGPLDAAGWNYLMGLHLNLHRQQILSILRGGEILRAGSREAAGPKPR